MQAQHIQSLIKTNRKQQLFRQIITNDQFLGNRTPVARFYFKAKQVDCHQID